MRYILIFLSLFMIANIVTAQSSKIVYLSSDSSKVPVYFDTVNFVKNTSNQPLFLLNGIPNTMEDIGLLKPNSIISVDVRKKDTIVGNKNFGGIVHINSRDANPSTNRYLLFRLLNDSLHLGNASVICTMDGVIITEPFEKYIVDLNEIRKITISPYKNELKGVNRSIWLVNLTSKSFKEQIRIRGGAITASN